MLYFLALDIELGTFQLKFQLQTKWRDADLIFNNLKSSHLNVLNSDIWELIWVPNLLFGNTESILSSKEIESDLYSFVYLANITNTIMNGNASRTNFYLTGSSVDIVKNSSYSLTFHCSYDSTYYPFDSHACGIDILLYVADSTGIQFLPGSVEAGSIMFQDFDISNWNMKVLGESSNGSSSGSKGVCVTFTLKRKISQSLMTVFMPNIILLVVAVITNYFLGKDLFEAVISINATVLMTVASLFSETSGFLPASVTIK